MKSMSLGKEKKKRSRTHYCTPLKLRLKGSTFLAVHQLGAKGSESDGRGVVGMKNGQKRVVDNYPVYMVACTCALTSKKWGRKIHLATASFIFIP